MVVRLYLHISHPYVVFTENNTMRIRLSLVAGLLVSRSLAGQATLGPADPSLVLSHLGERQHDYRYLMRNPGDTAEREFYRYHLEEHLVQDHGVAGLLIVKRSLTTGTPFSDSLFLRQDGLTPVWEHALIGNATFQWTYQGDRVRRTRTVADSTPVTTDTAYGVKVFAFNEQELVLRSLPLHAGFIAILPLYSEGSNQLELDTATVLASAAVKRGQGPAWTVRFADPAIIETYLIDAQTRVILSHETISRPRTLRVVEAS